MENELGKPVGVTKDVIETFLASAADQGVSSSVVEALRKTLVEEGKCTERALIEAISADNSS